MSESTSPQSALTSPHVNNFDFLRLLFATFVLITHSYPLAGVPEEDYLYQITGGQASLSVLGVQSFFVLSGYLITKSLIRSESLGDYFFKRIIRVFPGLVVLLVITVVVCFFISGKSLIEYASHYSTRDYIIFNTLLKTQLTIDGVFNSNPYSHTVNGSLWTIPYEFFCYVFVALLFFFRKNVKILTVVLTGSFVLCLWLLLFYLKPVEDGQLIPIIGLYVNRLVRNLVFFLGGGLWAVFPLPNTKVKKSLVLISCALIFVSFLLKGMFFYSKFFLLPLLLIPFGTLNFRRLSWIRKYGDISYGIYLWGFFIQQLLMHFFQLDYLSLMAISIPLTYIVGSLSWHLVEKKALRLKNNPLKLITLN